MSTWQFFMLASFMYGARVSSERCAAIMQVLTLVVATVALVLESVL